MNAACDCRKDGRNNKTENLLDNGQNVRLYKCNDFADNGHDPGNESADNRNNSRYKIRYGLHDLHDNRGRLLYTADNSRYHIGHDYAQHLFRHWHNVFRDEAHQAPDRASYGLGGPYEAVKNRRSLRTENAFYLLAGRVHVAAGKYVLDRVPSRRYSRNDLVKDFKALFPENPAYRFPYLVKVLPQKLHNGNYRRDNPHHGKDFSGYAAQRPQQG